MMNKEELIKAIDTLKPDGKLFEVRILGKYKSSGYFRDKDMIIKELKRQNLNEHQVYITLNTIDDACYSRENKDKLVNNAKATTDNNITNYEWLFIDLDPERPSGIASSDEELNIAKNKAQEIYKFLNTLGYEQPIIALSGNGVHLLYKINLENNSDNQKIIENCLKSLDIKFSEEKVKVDTANFNPSRICKLYGTYARKGADTKERPHRLSKITYVPKEIKETSIDKLKKLSNMIPKVEAKYTVGQFDLEDYMARNGIRYTKKVSTGSGNKYLLEECVFNCEHKSPDAMIFQYYNGGIAYKCFHNHCQNYNWEDLRRKYEPVREHYNPYIEKDIKQRKNVEHYMSIGELKINKISKERTLSGIDGLDKLIGGFTYDSVTLWAAQTNAGKTTLLTQLTKSLIEQGRTVLYFNGEQTAEEFKNNLYKQIAEKKHIYSVEYKKTGIKDWYVDEEESERIDNIVRDKLLVYNNEYDRDVDSLLEVMKEAREKHFCRDFIIDNLMQIDIAGNDIYREQERLTEKLRTFAITNKCNIHLIAHSRKTNSNSIRLTMFDIAGTQNIANKSYNIITITRCDQLNKESEEYKKMMVDCAKSGYELSCCDGILEVLKTKGISSGLVGLKYDPLKKIYIEIPKKKVEIKELPKKYGGRKVYESNFED